MPRVQQKRGTASALASVNPTPAAGEIVWDSTENAIKIGDGSTAWASLAYVTATPRTHVHDAGDITTGTVAYARLPVGSTASTVCAGDDARLSDARTPTSHTHVMANLSDVTITSAGSPPVPYDVALTYNYSTSSWVAKVIGLVGVGSQPLGGWPAGSVGASLAGKASATHQSTHATGGSDALTPADIGAAPAASPAITGNATFEASSGVPVTITNTGTGNSFVVNDAAGDTTPFVVDAAGRVGVGSSQTFGVPSRLHVADTGVSSTAVVTIQGTAAGSSASPLAPSSLVFRNFQFDTSAGNARQLVRIDALSREQTVATGAAVFYCSNSSGVATEYFRIDPHLNGCISALPVVAPVATGSAGSYVVSFSLASDPNTGFGQVSGQSDTASVFTAGHERVRVDSSGRVGIGNASMSSFNANFDDLVVGSGGAQAGITLFSTTQGTIAFGDTATNTVDGYRGYVSYLHADDALIFGSSAAERIRVNSSGNVGIGTNSPASRLDVNGVITVAAGTAAAPALVASGDANTGAFFPAADTVAISTAGSERVRVRSDGYIGLGGTGASNIGLNHQYTLSSASTRYGELIYPTIASGGSATVLVCAAGGSMAASSSATTLACFHASNVTLASGASVTNQYGVFVGAGFTGGTNNYGIYSAIASGSGRWNFYADSTAGNYFGGDTGIKTNGPTAALDINADTLRLRTARTPASAAAAGNAGDICWDASYLYICTSTNTWRRIAHDTW